MYWMLVGWSHHQTPIELRERLALAPPQIRQWLDQWSQQLPEVECVPLSTCNRVEFYCAAQQQQLLPSHAWLLQKIADFYGLRLAEIESQAVQLSGEAVIQHLFMVASSLDSMVLGEAQILSQVREAYELACAGNTAYALSHRAFQRATAVARRVANETTIHRRRISVPSVAVSEIATEFFERFEDKSIVLIGAGEMCLETLRYLQEAGGKDICIINRNLGRAQELAEQFSIQARPWEMLDVFLASADLVVSTTSAPEPIVTRARFRHVRAGGKRAVLILDLAVPRDFEPSIADLPDTYLYSVDDLQQVCERNLQARKAEWPKAMLIVEQETQKFISESRHAGSGPTIKRLRELAEQVKQEELKRLLDKLQAQGLDARVEREVSYAFDRLVNKLLHPPLQSLRDNADSGHHATLLEALRRLFQIDD